MIIAVASGKGGTGKTTVATSLALAIAGAGLGLLLTPWFSIRPALWARRRLKQIPARHLFMGTIGLAVGLIISLPLGFSLSFLPSSFRTILPLLSSVTFGLLGMGIMIIRAEDFLAMWSYSIGRSKPRPTDDRVVLLDTSVIIDGRIADIGRTGFIEGEMLVPRFVLNELQHIADSPDVLRRNRGRRGLDMLRRLQEEAITPVRITDLDIEEVREVDDKLVLLAKRLRCPIITNDYNLNRVAELQGIRVLNINELANAVKALLLPGESLAVKIVQEGKEVGQGVGYLDDGTMVVVEDGKSHVNQEMEVIVTKVLQTAAGRMLFARLTR